MIKNVVIGGKKCRLKTSAALPRIYRDKFKRDIILDMNDIFAYIGERDAINAEHINDKDYTPAAGLKPEHYDNIERIAYAMHKYGDPSQPDDFDEWLESFRWTDVYDFFPYIIEMWIDEIKEIKPSKKKGEK